ncbi:MAG: phage tail protein, partial [Bryobacteraceae bacterium]
SFARTAAHCDAPIQTLDLNGNQTLIPRYQCNLVVRKRRSAADVLRGVRNASSLYLTYGDDGKLELLPESTLAVQQATKAPGSNAQTALDGGWPAYEFGDGTYGISGILRNDNGEPSIRIWSRSTADTPNRASVEFQDAFNEYQQDSISLADVDDVVSAGQEVTATLAALGIPNMDQAARAVRRFLDKSVRGNTYVEFDTSVRSLGLRPGDIVAMTYLKEGFQRQPFRVTKIAPGTNYRTATITAQIHDDSWYDDANGVIGRDFRTRRRSPYGVGVPHPLAGTVVDEYGQVQFEIHEKSKENTDGGMAVALQVGFSAPSNAIRADLAIPTLSLSPTVDASGGTLPGDQTLYYAVSASDGAGNESSLSFVVRATIPSTGGTNKVTLKGISVGAGSMGFHVYRGKSPMQLARIASDCPIATEFTDHGIANGTDAPPDEHYSHANFYWRLEFQPENAATIYGAGTIGNESLGMLENELRGAVVRITRGKGAGQERVVSSNTATTLTLTTPWTVEPDGTSRFVVAESSWHFGVAGRTSPVEFEVPNRDSATVHISGRSANTHDVECPYELSPLTRWRIGGAAGGQLDTDRPGAPVFGLVPSGKGMVELVGVAFEDLSNTRTISAGTLSFNYWDELVSPTTKKLAAAVGGTDLYVDLSPAGTGQAGDRIHVGSEIMELEEIQSAGARYKVKRAVQGSPAESHALDAPVYHLVRKIFVVPFPRDFFGSPASGSYSCPISLPNARIASAEFYVTNSKGNSPTVVSCFTGTTSDGLRTLSGGQISIQVEGFLAIQNDAAPPLVMDATHSMRDLFAVVGEAPTGAPVELRLRQDAEEICRLTIPTGATQSNFVNGFGLRALQAQSLIHLDILSVGQTSDTTPGRNLTVIVRL